MIPFLLAAVMFLAPDKSSEHSKDQPLRVATFNIRFGTAADGENHWDKRKAMLFRTIARMDADFIGMQEVLASQFDELKREMPDFEFVGVGRNDGKRGGEFTSVCFRTKRFEKLEEGHFWLSTDPQTPGSKGWDAALTRMATWVRLRDRSTGQTILFLNTHFDHKGPKARAESATLVRERIAQLKGDGPAIVIGDFNAAQGEPPYANLVEDKSNGSELIDSYRFVHPKPSPNQEGTAHEFTGRRNSRRIDWILHTPEFTTTRCEIIHDSEDGRYPSDHFPVVADLTAAPPK